MIVGTFNGANIVQMPTTGYSDLQLDMNDAVSTSRSPWTQQRTVYPWMAQWFSGTITLPAMSRAQMQPWQAFLGELQGQANVFLGGNFMEAQPLGSFRSVNLVPDSDILDAAAFWTLSAGLSVNATGSPSGKGAISYTGTGAASGYLRATSSVINVIPGEAYTISAYINASGVTAGNPAVIVFDPTITNQLAAATIAPGQSGAASATFTAPANMTRVVVLLDIENCTVTSAATLLMSQPQLQAGAVATAYQTASYLSLFNAANSGNSIGIGGFPASVANLLLPGDNIQIGYRLYKVLEPVNSNASGQATVSIFPYLRDNPGVNTLVQWQMCQGLFCLTSNKRGWSYSPHAGWGMDPLQIMEAL